MDSDLIVSTGVMYDTEENLDLSIKKATPIPAAKNARRPGIPVNDASHEGHHHCRGAYRQNVGSESEIEDINGIRTLDGKRPVLTVWTMSQD